MARVSQPMVFGMVMALVLLAVRLAEVPPLAAPVNSAGAAPTYVEEVAELEEQIAASLARLDRRPSSWLDLERAATLHQTRGTLCNRWSDFAAADSLLARAFDAAPEGAGPFLARARLNFTLHRFDRVERDLARAEAQMLLPARARAEIDALRADLMLEMGRVEEAMARHRAAVRARRDFDSLARLAGGYAKLGSLREADRTFVEASSRLPRSARRLRAWVSLQRGLLALQANRLDDALARYREADAELPGWWLVEEHEAEAYARRGDDERALKNYESVLARTGDPEFMDAMARILLERGDEDAAQKWIAAAKHAHAARLALFPEAAAGHAAAHVRDFGPIDSVTVLLGAWRAVKRSEAYW